MDRDRDKENERGFRLYPLKPIALSSPLSESLPSYIMRLAMAHHVTVGHLIRYEIVPRLGVKYYLKENGIWNFYDKQERYCTSSQISNRLIKALKELTGNVQLDQLIFSISESFGKHKIFKNKRAWCPHCLDKWKSEKRIVYEPLIWNFTAVEYCKIHKYPLRTNCPYCGHRISLFAARSIPGFCSKCNCWLGNAANYSDVTSIENTEWHQWVYDNIAELLTDLPQLSQIDVCHSVSGYLNILKSCFSVIEISRESGIPRVSLREWIRTNKRINFNQLLNLSYCTKFHVKEILLEKLLFNQSNEMLLRKSAKKFSLNKKEIDYDLVEQKLDFVLNDVSPPSINQIAKQLSIDPDSLRRNFPEKVRSISVKRKEVKTRTINLRRQQTQEEIRKTILQIYSQGKFPSTRAVIEVMGVGYLFKCKANVDVYKSTLLSLGLL